MIAFDCDFVRLCRECSCCPELSLQIGEREISLSVAKPVIKKRNILTVERARAAQPIQHFRACGPVRCICAERKHCQGSRCERRVQLCLGEPAFLARLSGRAEKVNVSLFVPIVLPTERAASFAVFSATFLILSKILIFICFLSIEFLFLMQCRRHPRRIPVRSTCRAG